MGRSEVCAVRRAGPRPSALGSAATLAAAALIVSTAALAAWRRLGRSRAFRFLLRSFEFFLDALFVKVQLDAVVEMGFLQHLAQVAGAKVSGNRLFLVIVEVVHVRFVAAGMERGVKLLAFDDLLLNEAGAGSIGGSGSGLFGTSGWSTFLLFAEAEEPEACGRGRVDAVRSGCVRFLVQRLSGLFEFLIAGNNILCGFERHRRFIGRRLQRALIEAFFLEFD